MAKFDNISHVYKGLLLRNRAFASFRDDEKELINTDIKKYIKKGDWILDPMSGYGGGMLYFGEQGYRTYNIELNPPSYYWQILINPGNKKNFLLLINEIQSNINKLPFLLDNFSISDDLFSSIAINHIEKLYEFIFNIAKEKEASISIILPFVSRFANYQRSVTNITHFKQGGFCSFVGWENDFKEYLVGLNELLCKTKENELEHISKQSNLFEFEPEDRKFGFFVTSPPYPNYRDYSKLFKIENWILDNLFNSNKTDFNQMIGSNNVSGKKYGVIESQTANKFLNELLEKSKKLTKKSRYDVEVYYHPYFSLYFHDIQEAYKKLNTMLTNKAIGYIVVNDNITRDISVPVGKSICEVFSSMGFDTENYDEKQISHYGNIGKSAKRINSRHTRHILKVWKK
jgi:hypothetical protein